jgi:thiol-disulfide isomerase/thioredoxin
MSGLPRSHAYILPFMTDMSCHSNAKLMKSCLMTKFDSTDNLLFKDDSRDETLSLLSNVTEASWDNQDSLVCLPSKARTTNPDNEVQTTSSTVTMETLLQEQRQRNLAVALLSIVLAFSNYFWRYTHPITEVQLLYSMQQSSAPISSIGTNGKPSVVDVWAPWCENCKFAAPTLHQVEEEYKDKVNFVMINGDEERARPYLETLRVDAIPHLALVAADGTIETTLIGPTPRSVLKEDLDVLLENAQKTSLQSQKPLPYVMLDLFENAPDQRKVHFDP